MQRICFLWLSWLFLLPTPLTHGQDLASAQESASRHVPESMDGAVISTRRETELIAIKSYDRRMFKSRGISAIEEVGIESVMTLGFDIPGFSKRGDKVWMAVSSLETPQGKSLRSILWVHSGTGAVHFFADHGRRRKTRICRQPTLELKSRAGHRRAHCVSREPD